MAPGKKIRWGGVFGLVVLSGLIAGSPAQAFPSFWRSAANPIRINRISAGGTPYVHTVLIGPALGGIPQGTLQLNVNVAPTGVFNGNRVSSGVFAFVAYQGNKPIGLVTGRVAPANATQLNLQINPTFGTKTGIFAFSRGTIYLVQFGITPAGTFAQGRLIFAVNMPMGFFFI